VVENLEWPKRSCTSFGWTFSASARLAIVWRIEFFQLTFGT
jgi:hypothetical protein